MSGLTAITVIAMIPRGVLLSFSMKVLPLGTAYTVWTGISAVGSFLLGMAILGEPASPMRLAAGALIVSGDPDEARQHLTCIGSRLSKLHCPLVCLPGSCSAIRIPR